MGHHTATGIDWAIWVVGCVARIILIAIDCAAVQNSLIGIHLGQSSVVDLVISVSSNAEGYG